MTRLELGAALPRRQGGTGVRERQRAVAVQSKLKFDAAAEVDDGVGVAAVKVAS